mmetsp:Transcript_40184/g.67369  ORF Transcript_40184/g.67369 Transcript_40184/m.67369 type:complete len:211 (+) Transcript_40184:494-1126(+)
MYRLHLPLDAQLPLDVLCGEFAHFGGGGEHGVEREPPLAGAIRIVPQASRRYAHFSQKVVGRQVVLVEHTDLDQLHGRRVHVPERNPRRRRRRPTRIHRFLHRFRPVRDLRLFPAAAAEFKHVIAIAGRFAKHMAVLPYQISARQNRDVHHLHGRVEALQRCHELELVHGHHHCHSPAYQGNAQCDHAPIRPFPHQTGERHRLPWPPREV